MPSGKGKGVSLGIRRDCALSHRLFPLTLDLLSGRNKRGRIRAKQGPFRVGSWDPLTWATWQAHRTLPEGWGLSNSTDMLGACLHTCRTTFTRACMRMPQ